MPQFQSLQERMRRIQQAAALARRNFKWDARVNWYGQQVQQNVTMGVIRRLKLTAQLLRDKVVINLSVPVRKVKKPFVTIDQTTGKTKRSTKTVVDPTSRSKPGEFPRADTTRLMKDIFWDVNEQLLTARVGTTLDYGLRLELFMNRSFLRRTLFEVAPRLAILLATDTGGPLPGQTT